MGDWLWGSWLALDFQFPMLILRSVGSEQISRENYPFPVHLQLNQMWGYTYRTALWLEKTFLQATPQRLRILMSGPMRAARTFTLSKVQAIVQGPSLSGRTHFRVPWGSHWLLRDWMGKVLAVNVSWRPTPPLQIWVSEQLLSPHWLFGLGKEVSLLFQS